MVEGSKVGVQNSFSKMVGRTIIDLLG